MTFSLTIKTAAELAAEAQYAEECKTNDGARAYLAATDWYVIREQETGEPTPPSILAERAAARLKVVHHDTTP